MIVPFNLIFPGAVVAVVTAMRRELVDFEVSCRSWDALCGGKFRIIWGSAFREASAIGGEEIV